MPVPDRTVLVDQPAQLAEACAELQPDELMALDTEFLRTSQFAPRLCVVQIASGSRVFCVDELAGLETGALWDRVCAGSGLKVLHAAKQDMEVIWVRHRRLPAPLFDTQIAAALCGHPPQIGYAGLVKALLGVDIDKTHTRADWSRRPLGPELIAYAAADVAHLAEAFGILRETLERLGRYEWAVEDSMRLVDPALYTSDPGQAWRRLAGIPRLPVPAQLRARRLARWREEYAIRADRPRQWILSDRALFDIAARNPADPERLATCEDVAPGLVRRQGAAILAALAEAATDGELGSTLVQEPRPELTDQTDLKRLGRAVEKIAGSLGIPGEVLATRRDLVGLLRGERNVRPLTGWRRAVVGESLLAALPGD